MTGEFWKFAARFSRREHNPGIGRFLGQLRAAWENKCCGSQPVSDSGFLIAVEYGYRAHERGESIQLALDKATKGGHNG